jgi:acetylglutamate kinase
MPEPYADLPAPDRSRFLTELRRILSEPDPEQAERHRRELVDRMRGKYPDVASWLEARSTTAQLDTDPAAMADLECDPERIAALEGRVVLIKYGGNAMIDEARKQGVIADICALKNLGALPVVVHGGGPVISELLGEVGVETPFVGGHRKTDRDAMGYVEMALSGKVNSGIVKLIGCHGYRAVGLSGKDGGLVTAVKRVHSEHDAGRERRTDLGQVGDVVHVDTHLLRTLLAADYIPVLAPIGVGRDLEDYNINADMFAGHVAAALDAAAFIVLTDVKGIYLDIDDPASLIPAFTAHAARSEVGRIIRGGMIPKVESCLIALDGGVGEARIVSGMEDHALLTALLTSEQAGTTIRKNHE